MSYENAKIVLVNELKDFDWSKFNIGELISIKQHIKSLEETKKEAERAQTCMNLVDLEVGL